MSDLRELYQQLIVDHSKHPRNCRAIDGADSSAEGYNPLCGDRVTLFVKLDGDRVRDISFQGNGCAISTASASLLTEVLRGKTRAEAEALFESFHELVTGGQPKDDSGPPLGKLKVFAGVSEFPVRVKCATLVWHTLKAALSQIHMVEEKIVIRALRECYDPEIPVNIYDLGLIYDLKIDPSGKVDIRMTLTAPGCPVAGSLPEYIKSKVAAVPGVTEVTVELTFDPPWTNARMSEAARLQLGI
jgi:nitrogen fixation NifU-like protein